MVLKYTEILKHNANHVTKQSRKVSFFFISSSCVKVAIDSESSSCLICSKDARFSIMNKNKVNITHIHIRLASGLGSGKKYILEVVQLVHVTVSKSRN